MSRRKIPTLGRPKSICNCKAIVQRDVGSFNTDGTVQGAQTRFLSSCFGKGNSYSLVGNTERGFFLFRVGPKAVPRNEGKPYLQTRNAMGAVEKGMATIKAMVAEKVRQDGLAMDDDVRKAIRQYLNTVCFTLPGENDPDLNPVGCDFAKIMFLADSEFMDYKDKICGMDLHERGIILLVEKVMDERDDLMDYPYLRKKLLEEIGNNKR